MLFNGSPYFEKAAEEFRMKQTAEWETNLQRHYSPQSQTVRDYTALVDDIRRHLVTILGAAVGVLSKTIAEVSIAASNALAAHNDRADEVVANVNVHRNKVETAEINYVTAKKAVEDARVELNEMKTNLVKKAEDDLERAKQALRRR